MPSRLIKLRWSSLGNEMLQPCHWEINLQQMPNDALKEVKHGVLVFDSPKMVVRVHRLILE